MYVIIVTCLVSKKLQYLTLDTKEGYSSNERLEIGLVSKSVILDTKINLDKLHEMDSLKKRYCTNRTL